MEDKNQIKYSPDGQKIAVVLEDPKISSGAKLVLFSLIHMLGGKSYCFPSQRYIGKRIGLSERQVRNLIDELKQHGVITWTRGVLNPKTHKIANVCKYDLSNLLKLKEKSL